MPRNLAALSLCGSILKTTGFIQYRAIPKVLFSHQDWVHHTRCVFHATSLWIANCAEDIGFVFEKPQCRHISKLTRFVWQKTRQMTWAANEPMQDIWLGTAGVSLTKTIINSIKHGSYDITSFIDYLNDKILLKLHGHRYNLSCTMFYSTLLKTR